MLTIIEPQNAGQNPLICRPRPNGSEKYAVSRSINALTTNVKMPSVSMISGSEKSVTIGLMSVLTIPKINPMMIIFHHSPVNSIPLTNFIAAAIASALIIMRIIK